MGDSSSAARDQAQPPLPAFLKQSKTELHSAFVDLEWQQRNRLAAGLHPSATPSQWARLTGEEVIARNRYLNVEPFANNRIKLKVAQGVNDYINASPIVLGNRRYIATQGPKDSSTSHFYRMLASETSNTAVVAMLTQTHEAGREKCFQYFPLDESSSPLTITPDPNIGDDFHGEVVLVSVEEHKPSRSTIRHMKLRIKAAGGEEEEEQWTEKDVYHLLFGGWPDFLIPEGDDRAALLELIALSNEINAKADPPQSSSFELYEAEIKDGSQAPHAQNPRIIHCSAGVGRSGTFIALDYLLSRLKEGALDDLPSGSDPVAETVDKLRQQRMMMIQGESQFMFCYEVLKDAWIRRWKSEHGGQ